MISTFYRLPDLSLQMIPLLIWLHVSRKIGSVMTWKLGLVVVLIGGSINIRRWDGIEVVSSLVLEREGRRTAIKKQKSEQLLGLQWRQRDLKFYYKVDIDLKIFQGILQNIMITHYTMTQSISPDQQIKIRHQNAPISLCTLNQYRLRNTRYTRPINRKQHPIPRNRNARIIRHRQCERIS